MASPISVLKLDSSQATSGDLKGDFFMLAGTGTGSVSGSFSSEKALEFIWLRDGIHHVITTVGYSKIQPVYDESTGLTPQVKFIWKTGFDPTDTDLNNPNDAISKGMSALELHISKGAKDKEPALARL